MKTTPRPTRRHFLRGAGGAALLLPHLPSLSRTAEAQALAPRKRLINIYVPQQQIASGWLPAEGPNGLVYAESQYNAPLSPFLSKSLFVTNLNGCGHDHWGHALIFTGWMGAGGTRPGFAPRSGPSLDQYVARRLGPVTPVPSLELTAMSWVDSRADSTLSWTAGSPPLPVQAQPSPLVAFERAFGKGSTSGSSGASLADGLRLRARLRRSLLDALAQDYARTRLLLGRSDALLLDEHLTLLREMEKRLQAQEAAPAAACQQGTAPAAPADAPARVRGHMDVILRAIACDATRVFTFAFGGAQATNQYPAVGINFHDVAHNQAPSSLEVMQRVRRWQMEQIVYLLRGLAAIKEPDGRTALDNSLVNVAYELGCHPSLNGGHERGVVHALLVGSAGRYFKAGQMIDVKRATYQSLQLTMLHALGFEDLTTWGDPMAFDPVRNRSYGPPRVLGELRA